MALFSKIMTRFSRKNQTVSLNEFFNHLNSRTVQSKVLKNPKDFLNTFQTYAYIGSLSSKIARSIARLSYSVVNQSGEIVTDQKAVEMLRSPMPGLTYSSYIQSALLHIILDGNVFAYKNYKNLRQKIDKSPDGVYLINPSIVEVWACNRPIKSTDSSEYYLPDFFEVQMMNSGIKVVDYEDMIHVKTMGPHNQIRGMGAVQASSSIFDQEALTTAFLRQMYENGGFTRLGLEIPEKTSPEQRRRTIEEWREAYEGAGNFGKTHFYPPGYRPVFPDQRMTDMEMLDTRKLTKQDISSALDMPGLMAGLDSKYNDQNSEFAYYNQFTLPGWGHPIEQLMTSIVQLVNPEYRFMIHYPLSVTEERANQIKGMYESGVITGNEYREELGFDMVESDSHLETYYIGFQKIPADMAQEFNENDSQDKTNDSPDSEKKLLCNHQHKAEQSEDMTTAQRKYFFTALKTKRKRIQPDMLREVKAFYKDMEKTVISGLEKSFVIPDFKEADMADMFNGLLYTEEAKKHARRMFTSAITVALNDFNDAFNGEVDTSFKNPAVRLVVEQLGKRYADTTINSRREEVRHILQKNLDAGEGISGIKSDLQAHFDTLNGKNAWRALRIAKTEASYAYDRASLIGFDELEYNGAFDIVGCEDMAANCNRKNISRTEMDSLMHHPNHTGVAVPSQLGKWQTIRQWKGESLER